MMTEKYSESYENIADAIAKLYMIYEESASDQQDDDPELDVSDELSDLGFFVELNGKDLDERVRDLIELTKRCSLSNFPFSGYENWMASYNSAYYSLIDEIENTFGVEFFEDDDDEEVDESMFNVKLLRDMNEVFSDNDFYLRLVPNNKYSSDDLDDFAEWIEDPYTENSVSDIRSGSERMIAYIEAGVAIEYYCFCKDSFGMYEFYKADRISI